MNTLYEKHPPGVTDLGKDGGDRKERKKGVDYSETQKKNSAQKEKNYTLPTFNFYLCSP